MPYYSFQCTACWCCFEIATREDLDLNQVICVNCREIYSNDKDFPGVKLNNYSKDLELRIENLSGDIRILQERFDAFEDAILQGDISVGFDDVEPTDESSN